MNFGLREELQELGAYIFGSSPVPAVPYQEDGNWEPYLPIFEHQAKRFETSGCAVFGTLNQIETLIKRIYGYEENYSERYTYLLAGVDPKRGTDPQRVYESIRKQGVIENYLMPMTDSLADFVDNDIKGSTLAKGQNWLVRHDFRHEWLWSTRPEKWHDVLKAALKTSPVAVSVDAWHLENGKYVSTSTTNNHWCLLYRIDDDGTMWVYDSYDNEKKPLAPNHYIKRAKRIWLNRRTKPAMRRHVNILTSIVNMLTNRKTILDVCREALGTDVTPDDVVDDTVACAATVTTLLKKVYPDTPIIPGTYTLYAWLKNPANGFVRVTDPAPGDIIISPTGMGNPGTIGHVGILLNDELIASNDSGIVNQANRGKFLQNHTLQSWHDRYASKQGMPVLIYRKA